MAANFDTPGAGPSNPTSAGGDNDIDHSNLAQLAIAQDLTDEPGLTSRAADKAITPSEQASLLGETAPPFNDNAGLKASYQAIDQPGAMTSWQHEVKVISRYTAPLIPTFLLQYTLVLSTMVSIGHLGTIELGAVSLGAMSANITGNAVCSGLTTSLDTLCAQAYGSGKKTLVGLQVQRMVYFLWIITLPIGVLWLCAPLILQHIVPEPEVAELAGRYLRISWFALPGFATFSAGKRFLQAQGNFSASLYIILIVAPLNAFLNWFFVWQLEWGFDGAPIAVIISTHSLWLCQVGYVYFIGGRECWPGFTKQAFRNWGPMIRLAVPGFVMVEAEVLAFEIITLVSSFFGPVALAANSVLTSTINFAFMIPLPLSIAVSTRIAHLIGARSPDAAKVSARVGFILAFTIGLCNIVLLSMLRDYVPRLFSSDPKVWKVAAKVLPLCTVFLLFDATASCCNGILRGLGRQSIGSYIQLMGFYLIGLPIGLGTGFGAKWELFGLWGGLMIALLLYVFSRPFSR
jgi:multidrug resistance protein, MATE family